MRIYQHLLGEQADPQLNGRVAVRRRTAARWLGGLAVLAALGCAQASNLVDPAGPRFAADYAPLPDSAGEVGPVRVVSFNIRFAQEISRATAILQRPPLAGADVIALQEMDERGVDRIARSLRLDSVHYPPPHHAGSPPFFPPPRSTRPPGSCSGRPYSAVGRSSGAGR